MRGMIKVRYKKIMMIVSILLVVLSGGMIGIVIMINTTEYSEINTTEFTATVRGVEIKGEDTHTHYIIYSEEYGDKLNTYNIRRIGDISDFDNLKKGQTVFFRMENIWLNQYEDMTFFPIISIRTEEKEIVSLSDYNSEKEALRFAPTIAGVVVALIFLCLSLYCIFLLKGINIFRRLKNNSKL